MLGGAPARMKLAGPQSSASADLGLDYCALYQWHMPYQCACPLSIGNTAQNASHDHRNTQHQQRRASAKLLQVKTGFPSSALGGLALGGIEAEVLALLHGEPKGLAQLP